MTGKLTSALALIGAVGVASAALAAGKDADRVAVIRQVSDCRKVADDAARLACYDKAAAGLDEAETRGDIVVLDRQKAVAAHREAFGLPLPSLSFVDRALNPGDVDQLEGVVRSLSADASGRWTVGLEDGAVWRQIDGSLFRPPHVGSKVRIRRATLGSFIMNVDGQPAVKVHRDR